MYEESVDRFLEALTSQEKFPFSTPELRAELKHTFWLLNRVDSAKALAKKLKEHPVFGEYEIVLAAGDGKLSEEEEKLQKQLEQKADRLVTQEYGDYSIQKKTLEVQRQDALSHLSEKSSAWEYQHY